jgi:hypothetical protein
MNKNQNKISTSIKHSRKTTTALQVLYYSKEYND